MSQRRTIPERGDVYWIDPNPIAGREMRDRHPYVVITPRPINALGVSMTVPVTSGGQIVRRIGLAVPIQGKQITGVAVCNQVRSFDIEARVERRTARYVERLDAETTGEIVARVLSAIDPA